MLAWFSLYTRQMHKTERGFQMFKIDTKTRKLLQDDSVNACAYIHADGVVITSKRSFHIKGHFFKKDFVDIFPCEVPIYYRNKRYGADSFKGRLVLHNATLLISGLKRVEIYENNSSDTMKKTGMSCDTVSLTTANFMKVKIDVFPFMSSDVIYQDDKAMSIESWKDNYDACVMVHEEKQKAA